MIRVKRSKAEPEATASTRLSPAMPAITPKMSVLSEVPGGPGGPPTGEKRSLPRECGPMDANAPQEDVGTCVPRPDADRKSEDSPPGAAGSEALVPSPRSGGGPNSTFVAPASASSIKQPGTAICKTRGDETADAKPDRFVVQPAADSSGTASVATADDRDPIGSPIDRVPSAVLPSVSPSFASNPTLAVRPDLIGLIDPAINTGDVIVGLTAHRGQATVPPVVHDENECFEEKRVPSFKRGPVGVKEVVPFDTFVTPPLLTPHPPPRRHGHASASLRAAAPGSAAAASSLPGCAGDKCGDESVYMSKTHAGARTGWSGSSTRWWTAVKEATPKAAPATAAPAATTTTRMESTTGAGIGSEEATSGIRP